MLKGCEAGDPTRRDKLLVQHSSRQLSIAGNSAFRATCLYAASSWRM